MCKLIIASALLAESPAAAQFELSPIQPSDILRQQTLKNVLDSNTRAGRQARCRRIADAERRAACLRAANRPIQRGSSRAAPPAD